MGDLLMQLVHSIGRYISYHTVRVVRGKKENGHARPGAPAAIATSALISTLDDDAGLDSAYEQRVPWAAYRECAAPPEVLSDGLYRLWNTIPLGHKWTHYFPIYEAIFGPRRAEPLRILEIGVLAGASLRLWRSYFAHPDSIIVGIDIDASCQKYESLADGINVRIGSQADAAFLSRVVEEFGPFDLIIDDGSHFSSHMIASFNHLYSDALKDSGIYVVEDLHANYWTPWRDSRKSFLDVCKEMLEHMHAHYVSAPPAAFMIKKASDQPMASLDVPRITTMIKEIRFFDSVVAIYKTRRNHIPYYLRQEA